MDRRLRRQITPELHDLLKQHPDFSAELTRGGHVRVTHKSGAFFFTAATPSDRRSVRKVEADMRRIEREAAS